MVFGEGYIESGTEEYVKRGSSDNAYEGPGQKFYPFSGCSL
jgi:hypothetical protein